MMELITLTALAILLAPYFSKAGEKLAEKTVEIALENRQDIKDKFLNLFKRSEILSLGLNERQSPEEVKALIAKPEAAEEVRKTLESNPDLLKELLEIIKAQAGKDSSGITINAEKIGQVINENYGTINQTLNF